MSKVLSKPGLNLIVDLVGQEALPLLKQLGQFTRQLLQDQRWQDQVLHPRPLAFLRRPAHRRWLYAVLAIALLKWDWSTGVALGSGASVALLVYHLHRHPNKLDWGKVVYFCHKSLSHPPTLALLCGGVVSFSTYLGFALWQTNPGHGWAIGLILPGLGTLTLLLLLLQFIGPSPSPAVDPFEQWVAELTQSDPLRRLIAIHQLVHLAQTQPLQPLQKQRLGAYLQLLVAQERTVVVRNAALEGLDTLELRRCSISPVSTLTKRPLKDKENRWPPPPLPVPTPLPAPALNSLELSPCSASIPVRTVQPSQG